MPVNPAFNMFLKATERGDVVKEINKGLEILCSDESITFIDIYNFLTTPGTDLLNPDFTNDGLHLMGAGYLRWAEAIKKHLEE